MARRTLLITYIAAYLLAVGGIIRTLIRFSDDRFWPIAILLGVYLVLLFSEPVFIRRDRLFTYLYLLVQTTIICTVAFLTPSVDFWAMLFCPLIVQAMHNFPQRTGFLITGMEDLTSRLITSPTARASNNRSISNPLIGSCKPTLRALSSWPCCRSAIDWRGNCMIRSPSPCIA